MQLKQQLATLTSSLATLLEEKSKMESNFQTDKKTILVRYVTVQYQQCYLEYNYYEFSDLIGQNSASKSLRSLQVY